MACIASPRCAGTYSSCGVELTCSVLVARFIQTYLCGFIAWRKPQCFTRGKGRLASCCACLPDVRIIQVRRWGHHDASPSFVRLNNSGTRILGALTQALARLLSMRYAYTVPLLQSY